MGPVPGLGRFHGGGHGNPLQYFCLENPIDRGAWWAMVHGVAKGQTWLKQLSPWINKTDHLQDCRMGQLVLLNSSLFLNLWLPKGRWREERVKEFRIDIYTLLYLKWVTIEVLMYITVNSAQWYVAAQMGGKFGGEWIHVYIWLSSFCCPSETITTLLTTKFLFLLLLLFSL